MQVFYIFSELFDQNDFVSTSYLCNIGCCTNSLFDKKSQGGSRGGNPPYDLPRSIPAHFAPMLAVGKCRFHEAGEQDAD